MRSIFFSIAVIVSTTFLGGCATSYLLSPDDLAGQLKSGQKSESSSLATTVSSQVPNHDIAGSVERIVCTNQTGDSIWVYPNQNTELHITKRSGEMLTLYFDTVLLEGTKLRGITSRVNKTEREVNLSDILKIEVYAVNSRIEPIHPR